MGAAEFNRHPALMKCPTCLGEMVQKNRMLLLGVGLAMIASILLILISRYFWLPVAIAVPVGVYLLFWATRGKGLRCRNCKKFSLF
jgi:hypothetical protein